MSAKRLALVAIVLMRAAPIVPPVCCVAFTSALATPASCSLTPMSAVLLKATNERPMPAPPSANAGNRSQK